MGRFWTWKVIVAAGLWAGLQILARDLADAPMEATGEIIGALLGSLVLVAILKLLYLGLRRGASKARGTIAQRT